MPGMGTKLAEILAMQPSMSQDQYDFAPHPERDALKAQRMQQMLRMQDMQDEGMALPPPMPAASPMGDAMAPGPNESKIAEILGMASQMTPQQREVMQMRMLESLRNSMGQ